MGYGKLPLTFGLAFYLFSGLGSYASAQHRREAYDGMSRIEADTIPNGIPDNHALFVCGADEDRNIIDMENAYGNLNDIGFPPENIRVLTENGRNVRITDPAGVAGLLPVDGKSTKENVVNAFRHLAKRVEPHDQVFIYLNDHGFKAPYIIRADGTIVEVSYGSGVPAYATDRIEDLAYMDLGKDERISVAEVERLIFGNDAKGGINAGKGVILSDFCYSYEFAKRLGKGNYASISSSRDGETCSKPYDSYGYHFTNAMNPKKNGGRRNSVEDAFMQAWGEFGECTENKNGTDNPFVESEMDLKRLYVGAGE